MSSIVNLITGIIGSDAGKAALSSQLGGQGDFIKALVGNDKGDIDPNKVMGLLASLQQSAPKQEIDWREVIKPISPFDLLAEVLKKMQPHQAKMAIDLMHKMNEPGEQ